MITSIQVVSDAGGAATISPLHIWGSLSPAAQAQVSSLANPSSITILGTSGSTASLTYDAIGLLQTFSPTISASGLSAAQQQELAAALGLNANATSSGVMDAINALLVPADASQVLVNVLVGDINAAATEASATTPNLFDVPGLFDTQGVIQGTPAEVASQVSEAVFAATLDLGATATTASTQTAGTLPAENLNPATAEVTAATTAAANATTVITAAGVAATPVAEAATIAAAPVAVTTPATAAAATVAATPPATTVITAAGVAATPVAEAATIAAAPAAVTTPATAATATVAATPPATTAITAAGVAATPVAETATIAAAPVAVTTPATAATATVAATPAATTAITAAGVAATPVAETATIAAAPVAVTTPATAAAATVATVAATPTATPTATTAAVATAATVATTTATPTVAATTTAITAEIVAAAVASAAPAAAAVTATANTIPVIRFDNASSVLQSLLAEAAAHAMIQSNPASATYSVGGALFQMGTGADHAEQFALKGHLPDIRDMTRPISRVAGVRGSKDRQT